jgi:hypothetical protein
LRTIESTTVSEALRAVLTLTDQTPAGEKAARG